jgi:hypothetical protein
LAIWNHGILWLSINIGNFITPTDELIFIRGVQTTNQNNVKFYWLYCMLYSYLFGIREVLKTLDPQDHPNSSPGKCRESHDLQGEFQEFGQVTPFHGYTTRITLLYPLVISIAMKNPHTLPCSRRKSSANGPCFRSYVNMPEGSMDKTSGSL